MSGAWLWPMSGQMIDIPLDGWNIFSQPEWMGAGSFVLPSQPNVGVGFGGGGGFPGPRLIYVDMSAKNEPFVGPDPTLDIGITLGRFL